MTIKQKSTKISTMVNGIIILLIGILGYKLVDINFSITISSITSIIGVLMIVSQLLNVEATLLIVYLIFIYPLSMAFVKFYGSIFDKSVSSSIIPGILISVLIYICIAAIITVYIEEIVCKKTLSTDVKFNDLHSEIDQIKNKLKEITDNDNKKLVKETLINKKKEIEIYKKWILSNTETKKFKVNEINWIVILKTSTAIVMFLSSLFSFIVK